MASFAARLSPLTLLCCVFVASPTHAYIYAHYNNRTSMLFEDLPASFGSPLPRDGLMGVLVVSRPANGCAPIERPPPLPPVTDANVTKFIALIRRRDCHFDVKVLHAQQAGYSAVIVHNVESDDLIRMNSNDSIAEEIEIPSVFTSFYASRILKTIIIPEQGAYVILKPEFAFPLSYYLIPFTGVVGMIIIVMLIIMGVRCVQYRKRLRKNRLTKDQLKKIPIHKFTKGDDYDVCAICLDEYEEGEKLRVLPCAHAYHCKCVDPWLTQTKKTCPVCKQRVTRRHPDHSESESEEEEAGERQGVGVGVGVDGEGGREADSERTPLLRPSDPASPSTSLGAYAATTNTTVTTAQCLASPSQCDVAIVGYDGYYSPEEGTDSDSDDSGDDFGDDTTQLIGRDRVDV